MSKSASIWSPQSVLVECNSFYYYRNACSIYEIYPLSETPRLSQIAHINFDNHFTAHLLPDTIIWRFAFRDRIVLRVWDYRLNHSIIFSVADIVDDTPEVYFILSEGLKLASDSLVGNRDEDSCRRPI
jgi:hypothetical protein